MKKELIPTCRNEACFFGQGSNPIYDDFVSQVETPGTCHLRVPLLDDNRLDLPATIDSVDHSEVRMVTLEDAPRILQRYEEVLRQELQTPSELDRFVALPEGQNKHMSLVRN